jgi:cytochrome oxidase Cu insertion factor (SCO1/SenC/PrrC family)
MTNDGLLGVTALAVILVSGILWFRAAMAVRLPKNRSFYVAAWLVGVVLAVLALAGSPGWVGGIAAAIALLSGAFVLLTVSISKQTLGATAIQPGASLPEFSAVDDRGERVESASLTGQPLLLKFFRGHW